LHRIGPRTCKLITGAKPSLSSHRVYCCLKPLMHCGSSSSHLVANPLRLRATRAVTLTLFPLAPSHRIYHPLADLRGSQQITCQCSMMFMSHFPCRPLSSTMGFPQNSIPMLQASQRLWSSTSSWLRNTLNVSSPCPTGRSCTKKQLRDGRTNESFANHVLVMGVQKRSSSM
jgi:hypothetical protein